MRPVKVRDIFQPTKRLSCEITEIGEKRIPVLTADSFYRYPEQVRDFFLSSPAPNWKISPNSRNFIDYHDCRQTFVLKHGLQEYLEALKFIVKENLGQEVSFLEQASSNLFQLINDQPADTSAHPHWDVQISRTALPIFNVLFFLNTGPECRGGTAFYRHLKTGLESFPSELGEAQQFMKTCDIPEKEADNYWLPYKKYWELMEIIPMKFNRLVIFPGHLFHGAWHEPGWFKTYPRITQVCFTSPKEAL